VSTGLSSGRAALAALLAIALTVPAAAIAPRPGAGKTAPRAKAAKTKPKTAKPVAPVVVPALPRSDAANRVIAWVAAAHDNAGLPYAVIDKPTASLFLFSAKGEFLGETPVLLGIGVGDESSPGIGAKRLEEIGPAERTTPAGRFVANSAAPSATSVCSGSIMPIRSRCTR
jgi:hypothetical protein